MHTNVYGRRIYTWTASAFCVLLVLAGSKLAIGHPLSRTVASTATGDNPTLPALPAGVPGHFSIGLFNADASQLPSDFQLDYRYQYLAGGVNTGDGWATWNPGGAYASNYINASKAQGLIPTFIYYQILQSAPNYDEYANFQVPTTMHDYYDDFKLLMQKCAQASAGGPVLVDIEPDLTGVMQQHSSNTNNDASRQPVSVSSSGQADVADIPNNFRGFYQALAHIRDVYAPSVTLGIDVSSWGAGEDIAINRDPSFNWLRHATDTATYLNSLGPGYQMLFWNPSDRDAAYYQVVQGSNKWWDDTNTTYPNFNRMAQWMGSIVTQTQKRVMMWQVPNGNRVYRSENNTDGHWQDNRAEYFLNPISGRSHMGEWGNYGFLGLMFGAGVGSQSHYFDAKNDGVTNPSPINGNNLISALPDDDGGYLRLQIGNYFTVGVLPLPGGSGDPVPTPVPTVPSALCSVAFSDVSLSDYFYTAVYYLYCHGAISGYADNTFRSGNTTTRSQLSKIIVLAEGFTLNTSGGPHFRDVPASDVFYPFVETSYNRSLINGYSDGTFHPEADVTRAQLCKIITQAERWTTVTSGGPHFSDVPTTNPFYGFVETAYSHAVISGYTNGTFQPNSSATRGQISKIVYSAISAP